MKRFIFIFLFITLIFYNKSSSQEKTPQTQIQPEEPSSVVVTPDNTENQNIKSRNINLDMQLLYGFQFNQVISIFNISQESDSSVYLLSSDFNKSADFGYNKKAYINSGFNENKIGLTANWNWSIAKLIADVEADDDSRGMFDNSIYSREEKGKNKISLNTIYKYSRFTEYSVVLGGAKYKHSLVGSDPVKSSLIQGNVKLGGETVWSASNRFRLNAEILYYEYKPEQIEKDSHYKIMMFNDFTMSKNLGISVGVGAVKNNDEDKVKITNLKRFPANASISIKGYKNFTSTLSYKYDIIPFQPEEFYLGQKYINPNYDLPPQVVHNGEARADLKINSIFSFTGNVQVNYNKDYYNYYPVTGNVLSANTVKATSYTSGLEANFNILDKMWQIVLGGEYNYIKAGEKITYIPDFTVQSSLKYNGKKWNFEWSNKIRGKVNTDPKTNEQLPEAVIGYLGVQRIILNGSYFYGKVENLYNNKYMLRKDYPEPGISILGGLRILI